MLKNDEKIDIQLEEDVSDDMPAVAKAKRFYATAHRYIEISQFMKKYEDRDKYLHRGIRYMKKCHPQLDVRAELKQLRLQLFKQRAEGRIELYEEADSILQKARNERDYAAALDLFKRIHTHELTHSIPENLIEPELFQKLEQCSDSEQKMEYCEQQLNALAVRTKNKSRITSAIVLILMVAALLFSRTTACSAVLGEVLKATGNYTLAYQRFNKVYRLTNDEASREKENECHYLAAQKAAEIEDYDTAFKEYSIAARRGYKDSKEQILALEKKQLATAEVGNSVTFGGDGLMKWYVLEKQGNKLFLFKKYAIDKNGVTTGMTDIPAFDEKGGENVTWETSSVRKWLNNEYLDEKFSDIEKEAIVETEVVTEPNETYGTPGGNTTKDKIFLLSAPEYEKYSYLFHQTESDWWTRTPGNEPGTMTYVNRYKTIMDYGYEVTSTHLSTKPVLWVEY